MDTVRIPMKAVRRTPAALTTLTLLLGIAATGCSSDNNDATTDRPSATGAPTPARTTCAPPEAGENAQDTASYRMVASASDPEKMLTRAQVDADGLTEGELVTGGDMASAEAKATGHVEVAICEVATGETVSGADVSMEIRSDGNTRPMTVMEMRGLDEPVTAAHYGNNTVVPAGAYTLRVTLNGESAEFAMPAAG